MHRAAVLALLCALAPSADAKCAMWGLSPSVLTPVKDSLYADGFLVFAQNTEHGALDPGDVADQPKWRVRYGTKVVEPKRETFAPGLVLYQLAGGPVAELLDDKQKVVSKIQVNKDKRAMAFAPPKVKRITHDSHQGRKPSVDVIAELEGVVPSDIVAIVIVDAKGKALSWGRPEAGKTSVGVHRERRCQAMANGTVSPRPGDKVTLFYVSEGGQKSPASNPIVIVAARPGAKPDDD
jgi:hypothetical protein